jgi:hypothetical protein
MKALSFLILMFLISCGGGTKFVPQNLTPVTFKVYSSYYYSKKDAFDSAEAKIRSQTGKQLVRFVPVSENVKYSTAQDAFNSLGYNEHRVLFKSAYGNNFPDVPNDTAGVAYLPSSGEINKSLIVFNIYAPSLADPDNFSQVLYHETLHTLGFDHTFGDDYSIMNYDFTLKVNGLTDLDNSRLAEKYPFSMEVVTIKDLEKLASFKESDKVEEMSNRLSEQFGLSMERSEEVSKTMISVSAIQNKRALTDSEQDMVSNKLMGFTYKVGKKALEKYIQGDSTEVDGLLGIAADKNGVSPEDMRDLFTQYFGALN